MPENVNKHEVLIHTFSGDETVVDRASDVCDEHCDENHCPKYAVSSEIGKRPLECETRRNRTDVKETHTRETRHLRMLRQVR
jgi:hypothetical protein